MPRNTLDPSFRVTPLATPLPCAATGQGEHIRRQVGKAFDPSIAMDA